MRRIRRGALVLLGLSISLPVLADDSNYQYFVVGDRAAGMGGAHTAFSDSVDGPYYNPGGIVFSQDHNINVTATVVRYTKGKISNAIVIGSVSQDLPFSSINIIPTSAVVHWPMGKNAFAFSFFTPDFVAYDGKQQVQSGGLDSFLTYQIQDSTIYIGPSYARKLTDNFGLGVSLFYHYRNFNRSTFVTAKSATAFSQVSNAEDFTYGGLVGVIGAKWALPNHWHWGLSVRPQSIGLNNDGEIFRSTATNAAVSGTNPTQTVAQHLTVSLPSPWKFTTGIGYDDKEKFAVAGDVSLYLPHTFRAIHDPSGQFNDLNIKQNLVVNGNVGVEYRIKKNLPLRAGFFTNFSASPTPSSSTGSNSSKIDTYGGSLAFALEDKYSSTEFGVLLSDGSGVTRVGDTNNNYSLLQLSIMISSLFRF